jgi:excinuclease ABC subunit C
VDEALRLKARSLPREPGVYLWKGPDGRILYVGKAQDLRARVGNYLGTTSEKTAQMVAEAVDLEFVAASNVKEALVLEQNLIKRHRPPYNVLLVDDKKYPYIAVTDEAWPRVIYTRDVTGKAAVFGPFPDAGKAKRIARMLNQTFRLRQCRTLPTRECLYYHMHQCSAPCIGAVSSQDYKMQARSAEEFLRGEGAQLSKRLRTDMEQAAAAQRFEAAADYRDLAQAIDSVLERQHAESLSGRSYDAVGFAARDDRACAVVVFVRDGAIAGRESYFLGSVQGEPMPRIVGAFVEQYYTQAVHLPPEILLPTGLERPEPLEETLTERRGGRVKLRVPERGESRKIVEIAEKNAHLSLEQEFLLRERRGSAAIEELQRVLSLAEPPARIEAFDISHHSGEHTVASMVVLKDGKPFKGDYRRFKIRTTGGGDDPGAMREVVRRRYTRVLAEQGVDALPDLVLIDGGPTQVAAASEELRALGLSDLPVVGLAKRFEELYRPHLLHPIRLSRESPALQALQRIRDEAHRFAIGYQGLLKTKAFLRSELDGIDGIGPERKRRLLQTFGSLDGIKAASVEELNRVPGINRPLAQKIHEELRNGTSA